MAGEAGGAVDDTPTVTLRTTLGDVTLELYYRHAPKACKNFSELAKSGYYNGTIFHRVIRVRARMA